jgi:hypothetical protein
MVADSCGGLAVLIDGPAATSRRLMVSALPTVVAAAALSDAAFAAIRASAPPQAARSNAAPTIATTARRSNIAAPGAALGARASGAQVFEREDPGIVTVRPARLHAVVADELQVDQLALRRREVQRRVQGAGAAHLAPADGARTAPAQAREVIAASVAVCPDDVHLLASGDERDTDRLCGVSRRFPVAARVLASRLMNS